MAIEVETKDTTALSDAELAEMADLCVDGPTGYDVGFIGKIKDDWVLVSQARSSDGNNLVGFSFVTLERIGGTPCILIGLASVQRSDARNEVLDQMLSDIYRRAVLAFPDEDVLFGTRLLDASGFGAYKTLVDVIPRPSHKPSGEERQWIRRLAKRFKVEGNLDDRSFIVTGDGSTQAGLDIEAMDPSEIADDVRSFFVEVDTKRGDALIAFGWAMAEFLATYTPGAKAS